MAIKKRTTTPRRRTTPKAASPVRRRRRITKRGLSDFTGNPLLDAALGGVAAKLVLGLPALKNQNSITKAAIIGGAAFATAQFLKMPKLAAGMAAVAGADLAAPALRAVGLGDNSKRITDMLVQADPMLMENYSDMPIMDLNVPGLSNNNYMR